MCFLQALFPLCSYLNGVCFSLQTDCRLELFKNEGENLIISSTIKALLPAEAVSSANESAFTVRQPNEQLLRREEVSP